MVLDEKSFAVGFIVGQSSGGATGDGGLNISYGDLEPNDTTRLWVKTKKPEKVIMSPSVPSAYGIDWEDSTMPFAAYDQTAVTVGGYIYLFGGRDDANEEIGTIYRFDPVTKSMESVGSQYPTYGQAAAVVGSKVYLFGGYQYNQSVGYVQVFDTESNTIRTLSGTTVANHYATAVAVGTKIYLFGGFYKYVGGDSAWNAIYVLDTEAETVTRLDQELPYKLYSMCAILYGEKIYLMGGRNNTNKGINTEIFEFDLETLAISILETAFSGSARYSGWAVSAGKLFIFGGRDSNNDEINKIYSFDPLTKTVSLLSSVLYQNTAYITAAEFGGSIYIFGGSGSEIMRIIQRFDVYVPLAEGNVLIESSATENVFDLIRSAGAYVMIGVKKAYAGTAENVAQQVPAALYRDGTWTEI